MNIKNIKSENFQVKAIFGIMIFLTIILLIPLFVIAHYSVKCVDDFVYFEEPENLWQSTHSIFQMMKAQTIYAYDYWKGWQGTYFSEWLVTILMGICGDKLYFVGGYLAIGGMVIGELAAFNVIFTRIMRADKYRATIVSLCVILMQILLMPAPAEAFYWFCSAGLYTIIYALAMLLITLVVMLLTIKNPAKKKTAIYEVGIILLSFAIGGSNYVIAMMILLLYAASTLILWIYKHKLKVLMTINFLCYIVFLIISIMAPGNQNRLDISNVVGYSMVESILLSLIEAAKYVNQWMVLPYMLVGVLMIPIIVKMVNREKFSYPIPFLVTLISFGMFAAQFTPNIYSIGIIGAERVKNLYRMTMLIWLYGNELYWIGWFVNRRTEKTSDETERTSFLLPGWCVGLALLTFSLVLWGGSTVTSVSAAMSLKRGEAQQYKAEYNERLEILRDDSIREVSFHPYTYKPYVLFYGDIVENPEDWVNRSVAGVFDKEYVKLIGE